ncbi:hypothetical protein [Flavobacterium aestivum]|uniref:hypothetical protein n=1 Tax=Flavobacterium aestivum TaxID=3003257 RepID=UPI00248294A6|nr:hypothetical protein [Flavobacterium aestivum]
MKNTFLCLFIFLNSIWGYSQEKQSFPKGVIIDSVKIANTLNESYAVYLPKQYVKEVPSAIVFIFDPDARGKIGIEPFVLAAETYNYILVCSNNSKNGPVDVNLEIAGRLFDSVSTEFNLNPSQLYISGFSGGARLVSGIAVSSTAFEGVIACGASFNELDKFALQEGTFSYVGIVGDRDMNYQEMIGNKEWLDVMMVKNTLFVDHQEHAWPSQKQMLRAFDWLEIQAFKKNIRKSNESTIKRIYDENLKIADSLKGKNELISAVDEYERCNEIYGNKKDSEIKSIIEAIKNGKEYKSQIRVRGEIIALENKTTSLFLDQLDNELKVAKSENDFKFWKTELKRLKEKKMKSNDVAIKSMVDRLYSMINASVYGAAQESKRNFQNDKLAYCKELEKVIHSIEIN